jgi:hypothetical protein
MIQAFLDFNISSIFGIFCSLISVLVAFLKNGSLFASLGDTKVIAIHFLFALPVLHTLCIYASGFCGKE